LIGLLTTALVTLSTTNLISESTPAWINFKTVIKLLAIVFPAIATAVAALNAFYDPKSEFVRQARNADSAGQLHRQLAVGVWVLSCTNDVASPDWKNNASQIDQWVNTHKTITAPPSAKPDTSGSSDNTTGDKTSSTKK
jgi:hypothetical protein